MRFVYKHYPLSIHPLAPGAHAAAAAAQRQGKFWEMYALIFENRQSLDRATYVAHAEKLGLERNIFSSKRIGFPGCILIVLAIFKVG